MSGVEGHIRIELGRPVRITAQRPLAAARLFAGKTPTETLTTLPLLFNVCGMAQAQASVDAIEQALGVTPPPDTRRARRLLVLFETAREHLARILLDWPGLFGFDRPRGDLGWLGRLLPALRKTLSDGRSDPFQPGATARPDPAPLRAEIARLERILEADVLGVSPYRWLELAGAGPLADWAGASEAVAARSVSILLDRGWADQGQATCRPLPDPLDHARLTDALLQAETTGFVARPVWEREPRETGPLARQLGHPLVRAVRDRFGDGLLARWVARLVELAALPQRLRAVLNGHETPAPAPASPPGEGLAAVEAARGRLHHRVALDSGRIRDYQILAPTEWNFHPEGVAAQALSDIRVEDDERRLSLARLLVNAIDPCVACTLELRHA